MDSSECLDNHVKDVSINVTNVLISQKIDGIISTMKLESDRNFWI